MILLQDIKIKVMILVFDPIKCLYCKEADMEKSYG